MAENDEDADLLLYADLLDHDGHDDGADRVGEPSEPVVEEGASSRGAPRRHAPARARSPTGPAGAPVLARGHP